jgi:hypothetical protein
MLTEAGQVVHHFCDAVDRFNGILTFRVISVEKYDCKDDGLGIF